MIEPKWIRFTEYLPPIETLVWVFTPTYSDQVQLARLRREANGSFNWYAEGLAPLFCVEAWWPLPGPEYMDCY
ncbi:MAG TPA: hypothetical protein VM537_15745 [Anaerolineae bacterium]|nr:hypothetical protein [Anaerolineae bacterium]